MEGRGGARGPGGPGGTRVGKPAPDRLFPTNLWREQRQARGDQGVLGGAWERDRGATGVKGRRRKANRMVHEAMTELREAVVDKPRSSWDAPHLDALRQALQQLDRLLEHAVTAA